jgi:hypothetical protein
MTGTGQRVSSSSLGGQTIQGCSLSHISCILLLQEDKHSP